VTLETSGEEIKALQDARMGKPVPAARTGTYG